MHSPLAGNQLFVPFGPESWGGIVLDAANRKLILEFAAGYLASAALLFGWSLYAEVGAPIRDEDHHQHL
jgi:AGZA family xanthine/uracil permease-like MFS transporter